MNKNIKRIFSLVLALIMLVGLMPTNANAAESSESVVVLAGSDYQQKSAAPKDNTAAILAQIVKDYPTADGFLFGGDYTQSLDSNSATKTGKDELQSVVQGVYGTGLDEVYVQGNHDPDGSTTNGVLSTSGAHDTDAYGVYVINEKDYPWGYNTSNLQSVCQATASALDSYLDAKLAESYSKPIFVVSHLPLHFTSRTSSQGDGKYAKYLYDVLDAAGEEGLNIIFLFGHNHSSGYDAYLGNGAIYLAEGETITVANEGSGSSYFTDTLNFTYMNYGYVGYVGGSSDTTLTMTVFEITEDQVLVKRYDANGLHNLKAAGVTSSGNPAADTTVVGPEGAAITLGAPRTKVTLTHGDVTVTAAGLTGLTAVKADAPAFNTVLYAGYESYAVAAEGYVPGDNAKVTIVLGDGDFDLAREITLTFPDGTQEQLTAADGAVSFNTSELGTFILSQKNSVHIEIPDSGVEDDAEGNIWRQADSITDGKKYMLINYGTNSSGVGTYAVNSSAGAQSVSVLSDEDGAYVENENMALVWIAQANGSQFELVNAQTGQYLYISKSASSYSGVKLGVTQSVTSGSSYSNWSVESNSYSNAVASVRRATSSNYYPVRYSSSNAAFLAYASSSYQSNNWLTVFEQTSEGAAPEIPDGTDGWYAVSSDTYGACYARLSGETSQTVSNDTESSVLKKVYIEITADCEYLADVVAVSADMVSWDKAFDGSTSGVYTGTVTYEGVVLGQITVTVSVDTHEHSYEAVVTEPTCIEGGYTTYTCACGDSYIADEVAALGHDYEVVTVDATCTENGSVTYTCHCGDTYTEVIAAQGHSYEAVVTEPTCTEGGYTTYTCACGDSYIADEVAALGHDYESVTVAPTCTENGYTGNTCTICGDTTVTDETPALGHSYEGVVTQPTCTEGGYTTYSCHCGDSYTADEVAALGHVNESVITEATCETEGCTTHTCTVCGEVTVDTIVAALGHNYETIIVDATCTADGSVSKTCVRCGKNTLEVIPALGHDYEALVTEPTCTEDGYTTYTCHCGDSYIADEIAALGHDYEVVTVDATCTADGSVTYTCACGDTYTEVIPALGHNYEAEVTEPTCTEDGYTTYTCQCGDSHVADEVAALGHSYESVVTAPTCTEHGYTTYTCHCGDSYVADEVAALGHSYESVVTAPTCIEKGYTTYTCHCGDSYVTDEVAALGHSYESVVTQPTCTEKGYTTFTCHCGDSYVADEVAALGHNYTAVEDGSYMVYTCVCGHSYSEKIAPTYTQVSAISSGEAYVITLVSGNKYYALSHANNQISVVQVTVSNGEITSEVTEDLLWTYSDSKLSYVSNGTTYYLYDSGSGNWWGGWWGNWWGTSTLGLSTSNSSTVSFSSNKLKVGSYYLRYSNGSVSLNRSATTTYCFIEE